jgi:hypothetical protein
MKLIDKAIAEKIAEDNGLTIKQFGLRFDKVVVRLLSNLRNSICKDIPKGTAVLLTITAPIKLPAKTEFELCKQIVELLNSEMQHKNQESIVLENKIFIRTIDVPINQSANFLGFVHNPECDRKRLLDLAANWLLKI